MNEITYSSPTRKDNEIYLEIIENVQYHIIYKNGISYYYNQLINKWLPFRNNTSNNLFLLIEYILTYEQISDFNYYKYIISKLSQYEEWKINEKYPGYKFSSLGRVKTPTGYISDSNPHPNGYIYCSIKLANGERKTIVLHRLIAETFLNNNNYPEVDHINRIRHDARVCNLRYVTKSMNLLNRDFSNCNDNGNCIPICQYDMNGNEIKIWNSISEIARFYNSGNISYYIDSNKEYNGSFWEKQLQIQILPNELWVTVFYKERHITVSSEGRIKKENGRITYGSLNSTGYMTINYQKKTLLVHRIVMMAKYYNENNEDYVVNHIDMQINNNKESNLEWCTQQENVIHALEMNGHNKKYNSKKTKVSMYSLEGEYIETFDSQVEAEELTGISRSLICMCCKGNNKSAGGYQWLYTDGNEIGLSISQIEYNYKTIEVNKYTLDGIFICSYNSLTEASEITNIISSNISNCCRNIRASAGNFMWHYKSEMNGDDNIDKIVYNWNTSSVCQFDLFGKFIMKFDSMTNAVLKTGINCSHISSCCKNERKSAGGYQWKYEYNGIDDIDKIDRCTNAVKVCKYKNNILIKTYNSIQEAENDTGVLKTNIVKCCKGKHKSGGGFTWKYFNDQHQYQQQDQHQYQQQVQHQYQQQVQHQYQQQVQHQYQQQVQSQYPNGI